MGQFPDPGTLSDEIVLGLPDAGILIDKWKSYSFNSDFLEPTDAWHFTTGGTTLDPAITSSLRPGARVSLSINGRTQGGGYIDHIEWRGSREGGTEYTIHGRDAFSPVVDAGADPLLYQFEETMTLEQAVEAVFAQFSSSGWLSKFDISNDANRSIQTGIRTTTKKGKPLSATKLSQQIKPYPAEGTFQFLTRFLHRFGLWCWPSADQQTVIVGQPSFDLPPTNSIIRRSDGSSSNVLSGGITCNVADQPAAIVATGFSQSAGANWARAALKVIMLNELTGVSSPAIAALLARNKDAKVITPRTQLIGVTPFAVSSPVTRPMFLHDDDAKSLGRLVSFTFREMSLRQQRMWTGSYVVRGHTQNGVPWAVDTLVNVDDDAGFGMHCPMYVRGRTFEKSRQGGTTTKLDLILPYTIDFGDFDPPPVNEPLFSFAADNNAIVDPPAPVQSRD